jgi:hypothetical protein
VGRAEEVKMGGGFDDEGKRTWMENQKNVGSWNDVIIAESQETGENGICNSWTNEGAMGSSNGGHGWTQQHLP